MSFSRFSNRKGRGEREGPRQRAGTFQDFPGMSVRDGVFCERSAGDVPLSGTSPANKAVFAGNLQNFGTSPALCAQSGGDEGRRPSRLGEPPGPDFPVDHSGDDEDHEGDDQEGLEGGGDFVAPEAEVELFVDPGVVLLCEEFVVGVPGREEDLVGAGGGDELDADGPEFFFLFLEVRGRVGVVLHLVVKRLQVVQHVHRPLAAVAVLVRRIFLDVQAHDAEKHQADGDAFELEERRHERQDADGHRNEGNHDRHLVGDVVGREIEVGGIADLEPPLSDSLEEVLLSRGRIFSLHNWQNFRFLQS